MQQPRYYKLQEFQAHSPTVNCASIGRKSQGVIVTGGDDKIVNLWTIGTSARTLSLTGHQSAVESVTFDKNEESVAAGSASGAIKVFDLEQSRVTRTLPGHKCNVGCLDFSSIGLVSGSNDTNVKLWDLRQRTPTVTFKGHNSPVLRVKLSPDGKWVASGDQEGGVKLFEVATGRVYHEFNHHTHAITGLEFHPSEMVMATSSADKTVKIWDLDNLQLLESTTPEATGVRAMAFHPDGRHLFAALQDGLRVWDWEGQPPIMMDNVDIPWTKVNDIVVIDGRRKLIGCSFSTAFVGMWVVNLEQVHPFEESPDPPARNSVPANARAPPTPRYHAAASTEEPSSSLSGGGPNANANANLHDFALRRNGQLGNAAYSSGSAAAPPARGSNIARALEPTFQNLRIAEDRRRSGGLAEAGPTEPATNYRRSPIPAPDAQPAHAPPIYITQQYSPGPSNPPRPLADPPPLPPQPPPSMVSVGVGVGDSLLRVQPSPGSLLQAAQQAAANSHPRQQWDAGPSGARAAGDPLGDALRASDDTLDVISQRSTTLRVMRSLLQKGDFRGAMQVGRRASDPMPAADLLGALLRRRGFHDILDLTCLPELVPVLEGILAMPTDKHAQVAVDMGLFVCKNLGPIIRDVCSAAADSKRLAVDMAFEQRKTRCEAAKLVLEGLRTKVAAACRQRGAKTPLGLQMAELSEQLSYVCSA